MNSEEVFDRLRQVIIIAKAEVAAIDPAEITLDTRLSDLPLAMDSIDFVAMVVGIEETFGIIAEDEDFLGSELETVADVVEVTRRRIAEQAARP